MAQFGAPPNSGNDFEQNEDGTIQTDGTFTMPQPIDIEQERADADVEASAFQVNLDHLVSRYQEIMKISHDPEPDRDVNPKQELVRLRHLGDEIEQEVEELTTLIADIRGAQTAYHQLVYALPKEGRLRVTFTAEFSKFVQDHNVTESIKGAQKRIDELKGMLKQAAANHRQLGLSLPDKHVNFDMDSESEYTGDDDPPQTAPSGATRSQSTSKVPYGATWSRSAKVSSGTTGPQQPTAETHSKRSETKQSQARSSEQTRQADKNSDEFGDSSTRAAYGSSEPPVVNPGSPASVLGMFRTTFQRRATKKTSPPDRSGSPLRFNADGSRRSNPSDAKKLYNDAVKTGADFSVYNSNPFYQNSCVKLPIRPSECVPSGTDKYPAPPPLNFKGITDTPFAGDIRIYPNWRDAFIRLVHAPGRVMQDSERLLYLKQCLKGAPLDLVDRYPINDLGYQFATQQLEAHYFDEQKARYTLRQDLQGMRSPNAGYADLLRFHQELVHICGNFYQAGEDITDNDWCSDIVMAKLPYSVRHTLNTRKADQGDDSPWTISQVLEELQRALNVMKRTALYDGGQQQPYGSKSKNSRLHAIEGSSYERTGGTFVGAVTEGPKTRSCPFCGVKGVHWPTDCPTYPTVSSRYARAKELDFCFVCLQRDHWRMNAKACKATNNGLCTSCGKAFHHKALCSTFLEKRRAGGSRQQGRNQRPSNRNQNGAGSSQNPKNGRRPYRGQQGGGVPVAPGGTALHPTSYGPHQRQSQPGRAQIHAAAAAGIEEASAPDRTAAPSSKDSGYTGTPSTPQQPSGSPQVADSYAYEPAHLSHSYGQGAHPRQDDDGQFSVVTHDSDAPTEPGEDELEPFDPSSFHSGYAAVGVAHTSEKRTHGTFLECGMATVFNPTTKRRKRVSFMFDSGSSATFVSTEVARELELPNFGDQRLRMDTFAQDKPTRLDTFHTHLGFDQLDGSSLVLNVKASQKLVPTLEAAFIKPSDEALLKRNRFELVPQHVTPDILIGVHEQHLFRKETVYPPLPSGFCIVRSTIGTIIAGSGRLKKRSSDLICTAKESSDSTSPPGSDLSSSELTCPPKESSDSTSSSSSSSSSSEHTATAGKNGSHTAPNAAMPPTGIFKDARITHGANAPAVNTFKAVRFSDEAEAAAANKNVSSETHGFGSSDPPDDHPFPWAPAESERLSVFFAHPTEEESLHEMAQNFWKTENIGIEKNDPRKEDDLVHKRIKGKIRICEEDGGRYQVRLPWKTENGEPPSNQELPTHMGLARGRLASLQRAHTPEFLQQYGAGFSEMERDEVIERFNPKDRNIACLHLMAHHPVIKETSATTKVRSVFDGSAHLPGTPAINDFLHRGPVLLPTMAGILLRTRMNGIVVIADIAKAFLQVSLHPNDRSACAFMWLKDPTKPPDDDNLIFYRFRRVTFGLKPSPFLLGAVIEFHLEHQGPLAEEIWRNCYVDNIILSADSLEEALEKYRGTKELFASAKMNVRQFASNCKEFNAQMPPEDLADLDHLMNLGYNWNVATDKWRVSYVPKPDKTSARKRKGPKNDDGRLTKRKMLRQLMRIFDPLSLTGPALVAAKLAVQEACKLPLKWDDYVGADIEAIWSYATKDFEKTTYEIPRHICAAPISSLELHICVDASQDAYGFASYIRVPLDDAGTKFDVSLAFSRCKVKPLSADEKMSIPRMELMAMALGARNAIFLKEELFTKTITRVTIWSDSMIVLQQLRNREKSKEKFVQNRLEEIRKLQDQLVFDTRYVHTSENPGDIISRGIPAAELHTCELWWKGIPFLQRPESEWPPQPNALLEPTPAQDSSESLIVEQGSSRDNDEQSFFVKRPEAIWLH